MIKKSEVELKINLAENGYVMRKSWVNEDEDDDKVLHRTYKTEDTIHTTTADLLFSIESFMTQIEHGVNV